MGPKWESSFALHMREALEETHSSVSHIVAVLVSRSDPVPGLVTLRQTFASHSQVSPCSPELRAPMQQPPPFVFLG